MDKKIIKEINEAKSFNIDNLIEYSSHKNKIPYWLCPTYFYYRILNFFQYIIPEFLRKIFRGYSNAEVWNLNIYTANYILPRLKHFRKHMATFPDFLIEKNYKITDEDKQFKKWQEIIDEIIWAMENIKNDELNQKDNKRIQNGCELLGKYFLNLWD
jgi:hypothetical protein